MELICLSNYYDTNYVLKVGESTRHLPGITDEYVAKMYSDFPHKFRLVIEPKIEERPDLVIENTDPIIEVRTPKLTKKSAKTK